MWRWFVAPILAGACVFGFEIRGLYNASGDCVVRVTPSVSDDAAIDDLVACLMERDRALRSHR